MKYPKIKPLKALGLLWLVYQGVGLGLALANPQIFVTVYETALAQIK
jgi:hypothetical protein